MYLFTRSVTMTGPPSRMLEYAVRTTEIVNETIDLEVALWTNVFGRPVGTFSWNTMIEGRAALGAATATLATNAAYHEQLERGQDFASGEPGEDVLRQLIHPTELTGEGAPVGSFAEAITAVPAAGRIADVMGWGVEIADLATSITGVPVTFWSDAYGRFGQVTWLVVYSDASAVDAANDKLNANAGYLSSVDGSGALFEPTSGERALFSRIT